LGYPFVNKGLVVVVILVHIERLMCLSGE
jgi:hypothetical protein